MKRRMKRSVSIAAALLAFAAACPSSAQLQDFEERRREALDTLVGELEVYAEWCRGKRLFLVRQGVLERLLVLEPDHAVAHRALGHKKDRDGRWVPPAKPKQFRDFDQRALAQASERYEAALEPFDALVRPMLRDERLAPDQRLVLAADVLFIDPDDPELRSQRGEVKVDDRWVLWETPQANARRAELATLVREAYEGAPEPERPEPNERELAIDLAWGAILATPSLRVLATGGEDEALRLMRTLHAAGQLHRSLFRLGGRLPQDCTIYLLRDETEKATFLASHPAVTDEIRAALARLDGSGVPGTSDLAYWAENEERRLDGIVRMILGHMFQVYGITLEQHPWIHEGFGLYLTDALIGTRLSWFVGVRSASDIGHQETKRAQYHLYRIHGGTGPHTERHDRIQVAIRGYDPSRRCFVAEGERWL